MKKLIVLIMLMTISFQSFADCRSKIESNLVELKRENAQTNQNLLVGVGLGTIFLFSYTPVGVVIVGLVGAGSGIHEIRKSNLKGLKQAIDEAYAYSETDKAGRKLKRLLRKVNRKLKQDISMNDLVDSIIASNENEEICTARSMNSFAKKIKIELE